MVMRSQILSYPTRCLCNSIFMNSRKQSVLLASLLLLFSILVQLGFFIWQAERIFGDEQTVYLKIVPSQSNFPLFTDFDADNIRKAFCNIQYPDILGNDSLYLSGFVIAYLSGSFHAQASKMARCQIESFLVSAWLIAPGC